MIFAIICFADKNIKTNVANIKFICYKLLYSFRRKVFL